MKIVEGFILRPLGREFILVGEGLSQVNFGSMVSLNSSAAYLWESVKDKEFTPEDLKNLLLDRYEVEEEVAAQDAEKIARAWIEAKIAVE